MNGSNYNLLSTPKLLSNLVLVVVPTVNGIDFAFATYGSEAHVVVRRRLVPRDKPRWKEHWKLQMGQWQVEVLVSRTNL